MVVQTIINLLGKTEFEIRGAATGRLYYRSFSRRHPDIEKYYPYSVSRLYATKDKDGNPVIGIWMVD